ncbi:hypothetical protein VOWphi5012_040 [Vibrio phage phi50-12]|uniref:Uncharacterized protein n=1 Tax=Vibrio phage phi50-12 TaxID=2654972 RepID=A0A5P8PR94_9CAUD|nr:hypothetical protein KNU82_gp040 [Vibrio phage phi50-12]QFR59824.1 hypothetical protein VOWphi5012_040 [Vibrio phage phi50-12]
MSKLSQFELDALEKLVHGIMEIEESAIRNSDNISDFVFEQFEVKTEEQELLLQVRKHHKCVQDNIEPLSELACKLLKHFKE